MAIQHKIAFGVLCLELVAFLILAVPGYHEAKRKFVRYILSHPAFAQLKIPIYVVGMLIVLIFLESVSKVLAPVEPDKDNFTFQNKFKRSLAERNFYLAGATLVMSFVLTRYYQLLVKFIEISQELRIAKAVAAPAASESSGSSSGVAAGSSTPSRRSDRVKDK